MNHPTRHPTTKPLLTALLGLVTLVVLAACGAIPTPAERAGPQDIQLFELVNEARTSGLCQGTPAAAVPALAWSDALHAAARDHSRDMAFNGAWGGTGSDGSTLETRLTRHGYDASAQRQSISAGSETAREVFANLDCDAVLDEDVTEFGAARIDNPDDDFRHYWTLVYARPVGAGPPAPNPPAPNPPTPAPGPDDVRAILDLTNQARAQGRDCGGDAGFMAAAPALAWNDGLATAARLHSEDMAQNDFFSHTGSDGSSVGQRVTRQGYAWGTVGENISTRGTPQEVVDGWLRSPGHCENIMSPDFTEMGAGVAGGKWTQVFARPL